MPKTEYEYGSLYFKEGMSGWHKQSYGTITKLFEDQFHNLKPGGILDFGAGDGFYGEFLGKYSAVLDGCDISDELSSNSNRVFYQNFRQGDLSAELSLPRQYDVIFSTEVIEHVYDYRSFLKNAYKATAENGYIFLTTTTFAFSIFVYLISFPKKFRFRELVKYIRGLFGNEQYRTAFLQNIWTWTKGHYHGFSKKQLRDGLKEAGWEDITIKYMKVQPFIYNEFFLNPFHKTRLRFIVVFFARILYGITAAINWIVRVSGIYSSNIVAVARKKAR